VSRRGKTLRDRIVKKHWRDVWRFRENGRLIVENDRGQIVAVYDGVF